MYFQLLWQPIWRPLPNRTFHCQRFTIPCCISLGYGISADFKMLSRSWTFAADVILSPKRVLDLQMLARMVITSTMALCTALFQAFQCRFLIAGSVYDATMICGGLLILLNFTFPQVEGLKLSALQRNNLCSCSLPSHPLLLQTNSNSSPIPNHPLLHSPSPHNVYNHAHQKRLEALCTCTHPSHRSQTAKDQAGVTTALSNVKFCDTNHISTDSLTPPELSPVAASSRGDVSTAAATNVGYSEATGLSLLVERCLGKPLDKSQQLSDWERRPLKQMQVTYAGECMSYSIKIITVLSLESLRFSKLHGIVRIHDSIPQFFIFTLDIQNFHM